ncbi:ABC transporter ATP-binding protein [Halalkalibacterium ligniniphilum]|uniref:ABC transporter ATP-binding protein n=1 Tax=Halalkalibacterium ligniniphilum TaxID=1134413 RepID=UPI00034887C3|nr:ABC transporter ATP-binding protein [Halalkalibacterium ligniniphilum]
MTNVFSFLKPYKVPMVIALALMLIELAVELVHPLLLARIIDDGIMQGDIAVVMQWGSIMLALSFLALLAGILNSFYAAHVSQSAGFDIRSSIYQKVQTFSFTTFHRFSTSSLITRLTNDVTQIQNTIFMSLRIMMRAPLIVIGGMTMAFIVNARLALILLCTVPLLTIFLIWMMRKGTILFSQVQKKLDRVNQVTRENLMGMRLIKAFLRRNHEGIRFTAANEELKEKTVRALRWMEVTMPLLLLLMNVSIMAVLWFGSFEVQAGGAHVGEVVAIVNYATRTTSALTVFSMIIIVFSRARASSERITEVLNTEIDLVDEEGAAEAVNIQEGAIEFERVSFKYPKMETYVLEDISFVVHPKETVAILGATGSGKSTLFQLIPRLYDPVAGRILIDGNDIRKLEQKSLRDKIGYVPQESLLFSGTIKENIAWGKSDATMEEIIKAAKDAQIHETVEKLPHQYETKVGQKGVNMSGGQKQRLSIARALVRQPKILLLDDSTSALDLKTEARLIEALSTYSCTTIVITQKLETAMQADTIIFLEEGRVIGQGSHEHLLRNSRLYQEVYRSQFGKEAFSHVQSTH